MITKSLQISKSHGLSFRASRMLHTKPKINPLSERVSSFSHAEVSCLQQLYLYGTAIQLKRMGYHMTKIGN